MNKKEFVCEAENLYVYKLNTLDEIGLKLNLSPKTLSRWNNEYGWSKKRADYLKSKQCFDTGRMYSFCKILPMFLKVKDYEDAAGKSKKKETPKGLTPDIIAQIEADILGIKTPEQTETDETDDEQD